jgi:trehalose/maltose hydrolase-like predicted phosphorylase
MRNGMVTRLLQIQGAANATVVQKQYAHREFGSLMVNQFEVDNSKSSVDLEIHFQVDKASVKTVDIDLK